ncbi:hypothetical protein SAMN04488128_1011031 [Chitinophaga eiseniae]|uniref:Uncharacterized protein n=1 Tax=Chitinophaga eiseniae TaxID=634771 RepID=A0A1T4MAW5_9BACT|nr:hypothetical protein SAMN04488128_1011031 [Chitinophaga eiseniae]
MGKYISWGYSAVYYYNNDFNGYEIAFIVYENDYFFLNTCGIPIISPLQYDFPQIITAMEDPFHDDHDGSFKWFIILFVFFMVLLWTFAWIGAGH